MQLAENAGHEVRLEHFPPADDLQAYVTVVSALHYPQSRTDDALPAAVGALSFILTGRGTIGFADGRQVIAPPVTLLSPTNAAVSLGIDGPLFMVAATLSPLGWAAITGLDAAAHADQVYDGADILGADCSALHGELRQAYLDGSAGPQELAHAVAQFLAGRLRPVNPRHALLIRQVRDWLSSDFDPALTDLADQTGLSPRQLQRLVPRFCGAPPKQLARKYRALRVAALLQAEETSDERIAELLNLFADQSHLIRELRHFVGRSPGRLDSARAPMLTSATSLRNFREFRPNVAAIPKD